MPPRRVLSNNTESSLPTARAQNAACSFAHSASSWAARRGGMMFGFTGNYRRVKAPYDKARVNTVCRVRLGAMDESHDLMGEIRD